MSEIKDLARISLEDIEEVQREINEKLDKMKIKYRMDLLREEKDITEYQAIILRQAAENINKGFVWFDSKEGLKYWKDISDRLYEIANTRKIS